MGWAAWLARASGRLAQSMATKACDCTLAACACAQKRRVSQCFLQDRRPNTACWEGLGFCGSVVEVMASLGWPFHASSSLVSWFAGLLWLRASHPPDLRALMRAGRMMRTGAGLCRVLATDPSALSLTYAWACIGAPDRVQIERRPTQGAEFRFACGAQGRSGGGKSCRFFGNSANR